MNKLTSNIIKLFLKKELHLLKVGFFILMFISLKCNGQIQIENIGDNWKFKVSQAIENIKNIDTTYYKNLTKTCNHVSFWNGGFSTTEDSATIIISQKDIQLNSINNISAALVHESFHLFVLQNNVKLNPNREEYLAYLYELKFLKKIQNVELDLLNHCLKMIQFYK